MATLYADLEPQREPGQLAVLNIQRTCVHDGPGIRSTVFFRGCPMRCKWCQNPETQAFASPSSSQDWRSVEQVMGVIGKDAAYYRSTHGGVTLSGGEPLAQDPQSLAALLQQVKGEGLHLAVETAGDVPWASLRACLPYVDLFLFDIKLAGDDGLHRELTGRPLRRVEDNIKRLVATDAHIRFRMCVVPGQNDSSDDMERIAALLHAIGHPAIELMRYYNLHEQKARRLDLPQEPLGIDVERSAQAIETAAERLRKLGIATRVPSSKAGRQAPRFSRRVRRIQRDIRNSGHAVCLESARLKTAYHKEHSPKGPLPLRRAKLLRYILNRKKITVHPGELLVGNFTSKRVGGNLWVDYFGPVMVVNLWNINRQTPVSFQCSLADKLHFYTRLAPYWLNRSLISEVFPSLKEIVLFGARTLEMKAGFNNNMAGIAHYIVNCDRLLSLGTRGIAAEVERKQREKGGGAFYDGVLVALTALEEFADRYAEQLRTLAREEPIRSRRAELEGMAAVCDRVPRNPAASFHEALQSILFLQIALCTESFENAISLGRLDQVLQPYYQADLRAGRIDYEDAKELLACFILKIDEIIFLNDGEFAFELGKIFESLSPVETVTVGGVDKNGVDCTNDVSHMILDICELKPIGVNMAARIHRHSPAEYVERIAAVYLNGSPMPALYNDEAYIPALRNEYETTLDSARDYSIVGCVEPVASDDHFANTDAANVNVVLPFLQALSGDEGRLWKRGSLEQLDKRLLARLKSLPRGRDGRGRAGEKLYDPPADMDALLARFRVRLNEVVRDILADQQRIETALTENLTTTPASSLYTGCIESGKDAYEGGTTFNSSGIQAVGVTDVADSLLAVDELVFKQGRCTLHELLSAMDTNFEGQRYQELRAELLALPKFGDDGSADSPLWVERVLQLYVDALRSAEHKNRGGKYVAGYYGLNANMVYGRKTPALPSGRLQGQPLANSICPHYGMQRSDLTSALNDVARVDFTRYAPNGTTLTSTIDSGLFPGENGIKNLAGLIRGYFDQGGMQFQPNLVDREILLDAYNNPGKHKDLVVRIAGYCAYFDDLSDELKREIINRSYYSH